MSSEEARMREWLRYAEEDIFMLNRFYLETRYPGNIPEFSLAEAKEAFAAAERVVAGIKKSLPV